MGVRFWLHGVKINIIPHNEFDVDIDRNQIELDEYESEIKLGRQLLKQAKAMHPDAEVVTANWSDPRIRVTSKFGHDEIQIISKVKEKKIEGEEEWESLKGKQWVLLVEMGDGPGAVAVFAPDGKGGSAGAGGGGGASLKYVGFCNKKTSTKDPDGLVGQPTIRAGWFKEDYNIPEAGIEIVDFPYTGLEQEYRIDQGYYAYEGDLEDEEVTAIEVQNGIWCYEGLECIIDWREQDPGPPPPDICGYTWAPPETYCGGGDADYHDVVHLFYAIELTGGPGEPGLLQYWWPYEFNQWLEIWNYWNEESAAYLYKYRNDSAWDDCEAIGLPAAIGHLCPLYGTEPTAFGVKVINNDSHRAWGHVWGWYSPGYGGWTAYDHNMADFPYTGIEWVDPWQATESKYDPPTWFAWDMGVYFQPEWRTIYIVGGSVYDSASDWKYTAGATIWEREEIVVEDRFHQDAIDNLTDRMLTVLEGNEDMHEYKYDPFTGMSEYTEGVGVTGLRMMSVFAGGAYYEIKREQEAGAYKFNNWDYNRRTHPYFWDFGIFTKDGAGIEFDSAGQAHITGDPDPMYAYCMEEVWPLQSQQDSNRVIYGMVIDGEHYRTDEYEKINDTDVDIPEASEARDTNQQTVVAKLKVRIGIRRPFIKNKIR